MELLLDHKKTWYSGTRGLAQWQSICLEREEGGKERERECAYLLPED